MKTPNSRLSSIIYNCDPSLIRATAILCSLLLSFIAYVNHNIISRDGIMYIQTAKGYLEGGLSGAMDEYMWPFYSILVALLNKFSTIRLEYSAQIINALLIALLVDAFIRLYWEVFPKQVKNWVPAITILAFTGINDYRTEIVRDWGFLAFTIVSLIFLLRSYESRSLSNSILWQIFIIVAFLFRIEAAAIMALAPLILLFSNTTGYARISNYFSATIIFVCSIIAIISYLYTFELSVNRLGRVNQILLYSNIQTLIEVVTQNAQKLSDAIMPYHGDEHGKVMLISGIFGLIVFKAISKLGLLYTGALIFGCYRFRHPRVMDHRHVIAYLIVIAFFIVYVFVAYKMILAGRWLLLTTILSLIFVSFCFEKIIEYCLSMDKNAILITLLIAFFVNLVAGIVHSSNSKQYLKEMGIWASKSIPVSSAILSNETRLYYYTGRKVPWKEIYRNKGTFQNLSAAELSGNDYLLLRIKDTDSKLAQALSSRRFKKIKEICNTHGSCAAAYKIEM